MALHALDDLTERPLGSDAAARADTERLTWVGENVTAIREEARFYVEWIDDKGHRRRSSGTTFRDAIDAAMLLSAPSTNDSDPKQQQGAE